MNEPARRRRLPQKTDPNIPDLQWLTERDSSVDHPPERREVVALCLERPMLQRAVERDLEGKGLLLGAGDALSIAAVIVIDGGAGLSTRLERARAVGRSDAAIIVVVDGASTDEAAATPPPGAFAWVRHPFGGSELGALVSSAIEARAAKVQVADLARQLDLQSHLASIGRISAGLTHELGNPLAVAALNMGLIRGECERLLGAEELLAAVLAASPAQLDAELARARERGSLVPGSSPLREALVDLASANRRMQDLQVALRALVGQGTAKLESIYLPWLVREVRKWSADALDGVEVEEQVEPLVGEGDRTLLGQIMVNFMANAAHAAKTLPAPRVRLHVYAVDQHAILSVRDNGPGIPEDLLERIFEPFFTTRRGKGGTGLGLALCREYARRMGAELSVWSIVGRGACFRVRIPLAAQRAT